MRKIVVLVGVLAIFAATSYVVAGYAVTTMKSVRTVASADEAETIETEAAPSKITAPSQQTASALPLQATDALRAAMAGRDGSSQAAQFSGGVDAGVLNASGQDRAATVGAVSPGPVASFADAATAGNAASPDNPTTVRPLMVRPPAPVAASAPDTKPLTTADPYAIAALAPGAESDNALRQPPAAASIKMRRRSGGAARREGGTRRVAQSRASRRVASRPSAAPQVEEAPAAAAPPSSPPKSLFRGFWQDFTGTQ